MDIVNWAIVKNPFNWALVAFSIVVLGALLFFIQPDNIKS